MTNKLEDRFWETKRLEDMSPAEWEALCDGCGKCCLLKLEDEDNGRIYVTDVACKLLDCESCQCSNYEHRHQFVPDCVTLDAVKARELDWLPSTCAYRLLGEDTPLEWWHPLISGETESVYRAGVSAKHRILSENDVPEDELQDRIVSWPL